MKSSSRWRRINGVGDGEASAAKCFQWSCQPRRLQTFNVPLLVILAPLLLMLLLIASRTFTHSQLLHLSHQYRDVCVFYVSLYSQRLDVRIHSIRLLTTLIRAHTIRADSSLAFLHAKTVTQDLLKSLNIWLICGAIILYLSLLEFLYRSHFFQRQQIAK